MTIQTSHRWQFFRAGGFDQVQLESPADLQNLANLDQKLWAALACPTDTLDIDPRLLAYIDSNKDGRIRARELLAIIDWTFARLSDPSVLFSDAPLPLSALSQNEHGQRLRTSARRLLKVLGHTDDNLNPSDTDNLAALFPPGEPNGDGLVPAALTGDESLKAAINDIITVMGAATDRSGEPAVSADSINGFFAQAAEVCAWQQQAGEAVTQPFGDNTAAAIAAITALNDKIEDYFTRVDLVAFDPRAQQIVNGEESELVRLASLNLACTEGLKKLPLAGVHHGEQLPLTGAINPAYAEAMAQLRELVVAPVLGADVTRLSRAQWRSLVAKTENYFAWQASRPAVALLDHLSSARAQELLAADTQAALLALVEQDLAVAEAADGLVELDKLLRLKTGLVKLLRNFVSFYDFYSRQKKAIFQAGTLFIDGKSCDLVVEVKSVDAHAAIAAKSNSYLVYCTCTRRGEPVNGKESLSIVAAVTAGEEGDIMVGRHGLFYDRQGNDWDATVVKVIQNAISVREAFWSPYRRISNLISDQIQKFAASSDSAMVNNTTSKLSATAATPAAPAPAAEKPFDIAKFAGIFAAIGLAVGALGTALAAVFTGLMSLAWWQFPLVIIGVIFAISGPSMLLAWFKLRRRSLGPILDGNGWAVNTQAKISIPFGAALTELALLPKGARRSLRDPYEQSKPVWPYVLLAVVLLAAYGAHRMGWLQGLL